MEITTHDRDSEHFRRVSLEKGPEIRLEQDGTRPHAQPSYPKVDGRRSWKYNHAYQIRRHGIHSVRWILSRGTDLLLS